MTQTYEPWTTVIREQPNRSRLITLQTQKQEWSWTRTTDSRTAILRGLAEYIGQAQIAGAGGRLGSFIRVFETHADYETDVKFPSAVVYATSPGTYDAAELTPKTFYIDDGSRRALRSVSELQLPLQIDFWANDSVERALLMAMLEDALDPVDWMAGARVELPHYHNARATYLKIQSSYEDSPPDVQRRLWKGSMTVQATLVQLRRVGVIPTIRARFEAEVSPSEGGVD